MPTSQELGVRTAAELIAKYRVGGIIYFAWAHNTRDPAPDRRPVQRHPAGLPRPAARPARPDLHRPGARDSRARGQARHAASRARWPSAPGGSRSDARTLGRIGGAELRALGIRQDYSPVADVNVNPANPVIGVRSFGADPDAVAGLVAAEVKGYQGVRASRPPPSTSRGTATPPSTATTASRSSRTRREQWGTLDASAVPGGGPRRHRLDHDRAHHGPGPGRLRRSGHALPPHPHRHPARGTGLRRGRGDRLPRHGGRTHEVRRRPCARAGAEGRCRPAPQPAVDRHRVERGPRAPYAAAS